MLAIAAHALQVMAAEVQPVAGEQLAHALLRERGPLELAEQQRGLDLGGALVRALQARAALWIGRIGRETEHGVRARAPGEVLDARKLAHGLAQALAVELRELAGVALGERLRACQRLLQAVFDAVGPLAVDQQFEIPGGLLELGIGGSRGWAGGHWHGAYLPFARSQSRRLQLTPPRGPHPTVTPTPVAPGETPDRAPDRDDASERCSRMRYS